MSAGPSDRERISELEADNRTLKDELRTVRKRLHNANSELGSLKANKDNVEEIGRRLIALEKWQHKVIGMAIAGGAIAGVASKFLPG